MGIELRWTDDAELFGVYVDGKPVTTYCTENDINDAEQLLHAVGEALGIAVVDGDDISEEQYEADFCTPS